MANSLFILDANALIQAANGYYAFDFAPGFWDGLLVHIKKGSVLTIDRVCAEIEKGKDELHEWTKENLKPLQASCDNQNVIDEFGKMMKWVYDQKQFHHAAKAEFATVADGWLVAYAKANDGIVVTNEKLNRDSRKSVKIPHVCEQFGVPCIGTFELIRQLKITLK